MGERRGATPAAELPAALDALDEIVARLTDRRLAAFLDYDGTLTPIVSRPEDARLSDEMRSVLRRLARRCTVAIVSGRDRADVQGRVGLEGLYYAGSHGFDIAGPGGMRLEHPGGVERLSALGSAEAALRRAAEPVAGATVERKRFAIAVHYRNVAEPDVSRVEAAVREVAAAHDELRLSGGKKVFELRPDIDWDKGRAVEWLLEALELDREDVVPLYLGDDVTDEDAFSALSGRGVGVLVDVPDHPTHADYLLRNTAEVRTFLDALVERLRGDGE